MKNLPDTPRFFDALDASEADYEGDRIAMLRVIKVNR